MWLNRRQPGTVTHAGGAIDAALLFVAALGIALRLRQYLFNRSFWLDEAMLAHSLGRDLRLLLIHPLEYTQSATPGFLLAAYFPSLLFGAADWALRLVPLVAGVMTVVVAVVLARREFATAPARLVFVGLVSLSPVLIYYSSEFKQYGGDALFSLVLLAALAYRDSRYGPWLVGMAGAVAAACSLPSILIAGPAAILLLVDWGRARHWAALCGVAAVWGIVFAGHAAYIARMGVSPMLLEFWADYFAPFPPTSFADLAWYPRALAGLTYLAFELTGTARPELTPASFDGLTTALTILFLAAGAICAASARPLGLVALGTLGLAFVVSMLNLYPFSTRLLIYFVPLFFFIFAVAIDQLGKVSNLASAVVAAVLLGTVLFPAAGIGFAPVATPDIRGMIERLRPEIGPDSGVVVTHFSEPQVRYYAERLGLGAVPYLQPKADTVEAAADLMEQAKAARLRSLWFIMAFSPQELNVTRSEVNKTTPVAQEWSADGVWVVRFDSDDGHW